MQHLPCQKLGRKEHGHGRQGYFVTWSWVAANVSKKKKKKKKTGAARRLVIALTSALWLLLLPPSFLLLPNHFSGISCPLPFFLYLFYLQGHCRVRFVQTFTGFRLHHSAGETSLSNLRTLFTKLSPEVTISKSSNHMVYKKITLFFQVANELSVKILQ